MNFLPEGRGCENLFIKGGIVEGTVISLDGVLNMMVDFGNGKFGVIPRDEGAIGIDSGETKEIALISRTGKAVRGVVMSTDPLVVSRRMLQKACQERHISRLASGDVIEARVTHLESYGAFVDIGCGIPSLLPIDSISVSRIAHPSDRLSVGDDIFAVVKSVMPDGKITISQKELLGTWEQNAGRFTAGETATGIVRSTENYGIFIELTPNLAGLAEYRDGIFADDVVSVFIKSLIPEKMKVKLAIVWRLEDIEYPPDPRFAGEYYISSGHLDHWKYSPDGCVKTIESIF
jgi:Ribosomal protein S1